MKIVPIVRALRSDGWLSFKIIHTGQHSIRRLVFVSEPTGMKHLLHEGKPVAAIFQVAQVMVDTLLYQPQKLETVND